MYDFDIEYHDTYKPALDEADWTLQDMVLGGLAIYGIGALSSGLVGFLLVTAFAQYYDILLFPANVIIYTLQLLMVVPAWWCGPTKYGGDWRRLGLLGCDLWRGVLLAVAGGALAWGVNDLTARLVPTVSRVGHIHGPLLSRSTEGMFWSVLVCVILAPIAEEVFFRGFLYAGLRNRLGLGWAIVVSAAFFALAYLPAAFVPTVLIGVILAVMYEMSGSLWPGIAARAALGFIAIAVAY